MHPRVDFTRHYLVPQLLRAGYAVWTQRSRTVGNDLTTVHEQLLIDVATAQVALEDRGFNRIFFVGNSGGASCTASTCSRRGWLPKTGCAPPRPA